MTLMPKLTLAEDTLVNAEGQSIFFRAWRPVSPPKAQVVICHGLNSHSGQYRWVAEQFVAQGLSVYALDLRGRGRSDGERFYVKAVEDYVADLAMIVDLAKARDPHLPTFLLGHSVGGVVACSYVLDHPATLTGLICESFAYQAPVPDLALTLIRGLSHILPRLPVLKLKNSDFTRDPARLAALDADAFIKDETQPARTVAALARANIRLKRDFEKITLPVLILHGTADRATLTRGSRFFFERSRSPDKTLKLYEGHVHDLLADLDRAAVMADVSAWIGERT